MSAEDHQSAYQKIHECKHLNCVEDENIVCTDCGLVLSEYYMVSNYFMGYSGEFQEESSKYYDNSLYFKVLDLAHKLHLENTSFKEEILHSVQCHPVSSAENESVVYYAYEYLMKAKNYIKLSVLCNMCGVAERKMRRFVFTSCGFESDGLITKTCRLLELTYSEEEMLKQKMKQKKNSGHAPATELGGYLFTTFNEKLPLKKICEVLGVNPVSVRRYAKKFL